MSTKPAPELLEREVRLGIVLYGGVSLAIYENGVAQELFRAVRGENVYSFIKQLIDSDIVVDILSGTSAGGINGVLLAYAMANDRDFKTASQLWREDGDILRLMRDPGKGDGTSLLDSRGYYQERLQSAFDTMPSYLVPPDDGVSPAHRLDSVTREFDLFVTGTDIQGSTYTVFDDQGDPIDVKDHRQVFQLSYRQDRKNEFKSQDSASLAKLCRITSCFPVAFEPVEVQPRSAEDAPLKRWGRLDDRGGNSIFYLDGGVLNNKPFSYTIDAITRRTADRDVDRLLLYVEPDPERFQGEKPVTAPNVAKAAGDALIGIPGYQSIASDLQAIAAHNDRVQLYNDLMGCVPSADTAPDCMNQPTLDVRACINDPSRAGMYASARLGQLRDRAIEGILKMNGTRKLLDKKDERHAAKILVESFENWMDTSPEETLRDFDVYFRKRRLLHLIYFIKDIIFPHKGPRPSHEVTAAYRELWRQINHQFKLLEEIEFALESAIDLAPIEWTNLKDQQAAASHAEEIWQKARNVLRRMLDTAGITLGKTLAEGAAAHPQGEKLERAALMAALNERLKSASRLECIAEIQPAGNLLDECDRIEIAILKKYAPAHEADPVSREYCRFILTDSFLFPMQRMAQMESVDVIRTVRISPIDAKRAYSALALDAKLCGNELGHFGGFLKRSWRVNDTMWGRLDAICQLIECLVTPARMQQVRPEARQKALAYNFDALFPESEPALRAEIKQLASELHLDDALTNDRFEKFWNVLARAAQAEILREEVPRVIAAAIEQQSAWNQFVFERPKKPLLSNKQVWGVNPRRLDTALAGYAATMLAQTTCPQGGWPGYFSNTYAVGSEDWNTDIPKPILLEMLAQATLVMRNCLLAVAGPHAAKIRSSIIYKFGLNYPLLATYHLVRLQRTAPEFVWVTTFTAIGVSVTFLALDIIFRDAIAGRWWLWAAPGILLLLVLFQLYWFRKPARPKSKRNSGAGTLPAAASQAAPHNRSM